MKTVVVFGTFDPLHEGHLDFFRQAKALGDRLVVIVARDDVIRSQKKREPARPETTRRAAVASVPVVDEALLGDHEPTGYGMLRTLSYDVIALGYDQAPADGDVRCLLDRLGKQHVVITRLEPFAPERYKSSYFRPSQNVYDLHIHSIYSDGDLTPVQLIDEARRRGVAGMSLTDHNGLWGIAAAREYASRLQLPFVEGIEVTALHYTTDVHILGYSTEFKSEVLATGLAQTRAGYAQRIQEMVQRCQAAGYTKINFEAIAASRAQQPDPSYISYDVAKQLVSVQGLSRDEARRLTVKEGKCYVPYGSWAASPAAVVSLLHQANAIAVLAHPGTIVHEEGETTLQELLQELVAHGLDGLEVYHPFHSPQLTTQLKEFAHEHHLLVTGGSDWHGPGRFHDHDFGKVGLSEAAFQQFLAKLP